MTRGNSPYTDLHQDRPYQFQVEAGVVRPPALVPVLENPDVCRDSHRDQSEPCPHHWVRILAYDKCTRCGELRVHRPASTTTRRVR